jgi:hypothetical protein
VAQASRFAAAWRRSPLPHPQELLSRTSPVASLTRIVLPLPSVAVPITHSTPASLCTISRT